MPGVTHACAACDARARAWRVPGPGIARYVAVVAEGSRSAVLAASLGNTALAVSKGVAAALTGSAAMMAETLPAT
jgi:hypothetical protein